MAKKKAVTKVAKKAAKKPVKKTARQVAEQIAQQTLGYGRDEIAGAADRECPDEILTLRAGQSGRYLCNLCSAEFDLTFEPKARDCPEEADNIEPKPVLYCPFCAGDVVEG